MASTRPGPSMAARCTACSTVFRVVADQLRVSEGWVRCGRCAEVFNAAENLIDLDTGAPRRMPIQAPEPALPPLPSALDRVNRSTAHAPRPPSHEAPRLERAPEPPADPPAEPPATPPQDVVAEPVFEAPPPVPQAPPPPPSSNHQDTLPWPDAEADTAPAADAATADTVLENPEHAQQMADTEFLEDAVLAAPSAAALAAASAGPLLPLADAAPGAAETEPLPSFVRRADRAARWRQPRVRAALGVTAGLLSLLLAAQLTYVYSDLVAARWPPAGAVLATACPWLGCSVGPARAIDSLSVESSGLVRVEKSNVYKLSLALRNRSGIELALPALDLSLSDAQGQLILRRVLRTSELGAAQATLPAGRELALQATLQTATQSTAASPAPGGSGGVAGYTIELFYP